MNTYCQACPDRGSEICPLPSFRTRVKECLTLASPALSACSMEPLPAEVMVAAYDGAEATKEAQSVRELVVQNCVEMHLSVMPGPTRR